MVSGPPPPVYVLVRLRPAAVRPVIEPETEYVFVVQVTRTLSTSVELTVPAPSVTTHV
jgi:hypothetical protein